MAPAAAQGAEAFVVVCSAPAPDEPPEGSFSYTVDEVEPTIPLTPTRTVEVAVGGCTPPPGVPVAPGRDVRVTQLPRKDETSLVDVAPPSASTNLRARTSVVNAPPGTTTLTFVTKAGIPIYNPPKPKFGQVKVCKVAGPGVAVGRRFDFTVWSRPASFSFGGPYPAPFSVGPFSLSAGWPHGNCVLLTQAFAVLGHVDIHEAVPGDVAVSSISVNPEANAGSDDLPNGDAVFHASPGITEVTYTNRAKAPRLHLGWLETCVYKKNRRLPTAAQRRAEYEGVTIADRTGVRGTVSIPVGGCLPAFEVVAGPVTIRLADRPGGNLAGCRTVPRGRQGRCARRAGASTVRVVEGDASTQSVAILSVP